MRILCGFLIVVFMLSSCSQDRERTNAPLVLSTDVWIGATPFYYAREKGWLREAGIELLQARSINDNMYHYGAGASDLFTGTQHEFFRMRGEQSDLMPVFVYDRSSGGDVIMANRSREELQHSAQTIQVYLESDTISVEMLEYFIEHEKIPKSKMAVSFRTQDEMARMRNTDKSPPILIVTYNPHDLTLKKRGFTLVASSKDERYLVVDGVYVSSRLYRENPEPFRRLVTIFERAVEAGRNDPKEFYETVRPYLGDPSYDEFMQMRRNIQWMEDGISDPMRKRLERIGFPTREMLR